MNDELRVFLYALIVGVLLTPVTLYFQYIRDTYDAYFSSHYATFIGIALIAVLITYIVAAFFNILLFNNGKYETWWAYIIVSLLFLIVATFITKALALLVAWQLGWVIDVSQLLYIVSPGYVIYVALLTAFYARKKESVKKLQWF